MGKEKLLEETPWQVFEVLDEEEETLERFTDLQKLFDFVKENENAIYVYIGEKSPQNNNNYEWLLCWERDVDSFDELRNYLGLEDKEQEKEVTLEDLHPEVDLPWRGKGKRHLVDANTFTKTKEGDIVNVHISDDLPDIKYKVRHGDYLDKEARDAGEWGSDTAAEYQELDTSEFNDALYNKIRRAVSKTIEDTLKDNYKKDFKTHFGGSSGNVPIAVSLTNARSDRKIPVIYNDKDTVLEGHSSVSEIIDKVKNKTRERIAQALGCSESDIEPDLSNIQILNCKDENEFREVYGEDEPLRPDYPFGWTDKETWNNFANKYPENNWAEFDEFVETAAANMIDGYGWARNGKGWLLRIIQPDNYIESLSFDSLFDLEKHLGRKPNEEEYKEFLLPKIEAAFDEYKKEGLSDKQIYAELKDAYYYEDLIQRVMKDKNTYIENINEARSDDIYDFIEDLYDLRKTSIANEGEYGLGNLVFKEFRNLGYLDNLRKLRREEKSKELSLESLDELEEDRIKKGSGSIYSDEHKNSASWWYKYSDEFADVSNWLYDKYKKYTPYRTWVDGKEKISQKKLPLYYSDTTKFVFPGFSYEESEVRNIANELQKYIDENNYPFNVNIDYGYNNRIGKLFNIRIKYEENSMLEGLKDDLLENVSGQWSNHKKCTDELFAKLVDNVKRNSSKYTYSYDPANCYTFYKKENGRLIPIAEFIPALTVIYFEEPEELEDLENVDDDFFEEYNKWNIDEGKKKRIIDYRRLAKIGDDVVITQENLDEQALNNTCRINYDYPKDRLIDELLN